MLTTLLGTLLGGLFRLMPEVLKLWNKSSEQAHELAMFDKQLEADKLKSEAGLLLAQAEADHAFGLAEMQGLASAIAQQGQLTGVKWVDAINSLMRPLITFWWVIVLYSVSLFAQFSLLVGQGVSNAQATLSVWGPDEKAIAASIISFWFCDRALRKSGKIR